MSYFQVDKEARLRDINEVLAEVPSAKFNFPNIGNRSLKETVMYNIDENSNQVLTALSDFKELSKSYKNPVILVGGLAVDYWCRSRKTDDIDIFFLTQARLPRKIWYGSTNFKPFSSSSEDHPARLYHKTTGIEIDLITPKEVGLPSRYASYIYKTAISDNGFKIASPEGIILMKLISWRPKDQVDVTMLLEVPSIDLIKIDSILSTDHKIKLKQMKAQDSSKYENKSRAVKLAESLDKLTKTKPVNEEMNVATASSKAFQTRMFGLAKKLGGEMSFDKSKKSDSVYYSFTDPDGYEALNIRISDHSNGLSQHNPNMDQYSFNVEDYKDSNALLKDIEQAMKKFKEKYKDLFDN